MQSVIGVVSQGVSCDSSIEGQAVEDVEVTRVEDRTSGSGAGVVSLEQLLLGGDGSFWLRA